MAKAALPVFFLAHGSPMLALEGGAWGQALLHLGRSLPKPRAVLLCSAHWETPGSFRVSSGDPPGILHDFGGFPDALWELDYPAPGSPETALKVATLLRQAGLKGTLDAQRPLDHGAWVPLRYLAPEAQIPVIQLSLPCPRTPELLIAAGRALAPLREEGVLILGSGGIVHNLRALDWQGDSGPQPWASAFQSWVGACLASGDLARLTTWRQAPGALESVPTSEHLDPLFLVLGAADGPWASMYEGWQLGSLSLASYRSLEAE